ncbi:MAG: hypothetical protein FJ296_06460 [Planctomycetes bacterium]|nr:hypothetical protein [Planctomycetota bacterium]
MLPKIPVWLSDRYILASARGNEELARGLPVLDEAVVHGAPVEFLRASGVGRIEALPAGVATAAPPRPSRRPRRRG